MAAGTGDELEYRRSRQSASHHSHSIVAGGLLVTS
jgi:hypothetical protein